MCATRSWHSVVQHEGALCKPVAREEGDDQSPQPSPLLTPQSGSTSVGTERLSQGYQLTWHFWHSAKFEVAHVGTEREAVGPREDGHSGTKLSMEDPGI